MSTRKTRLRLIALVVLVLPIGMLRAQSLFEDALREAEREAEQEAERAAPGFPGDADDQLPALSRPPGQSLTLTGTVSTGAYLLLDEPLLDPAYARLAVALSAAAAREISAYADVRLHAAAGVDSTIDAQLDLRELYLDFQRGRWDLSAGRRIVVWGRADGINPTDTVTPVDMTFRSAERDDRRLGNFMVRPLLHLGDFRLEAIWIPAYRPSVRPAPDGGNLPVPISNSTDYPEPAAANGTFAFKVDYFGRGFDGSVSVLNGYATVPLFNVLGPADPTEAVIVPTAYRVTQAGADFAAPVGRLSLRGEVALRIAEPGWGDADEPYLPNPETHWVVGADRMFGNHQLVVQHTGKYVFDFEPIDDTSPPQVTAVRRLNRLVSAQSHEFAHGVGLFLRSSFLHELLSVEAGGTYNVTTTEAGGRLTATWSIADGVSVLVGGEYLAGPSGTLNDLLGPRMNVVFLEGRVSF